ncbi:hypothetical protein [Telluria beijingensis]|uniref:hypothetical protein n=1 Tax=Telluria beijingensis TaxID=3068633 RepID=UPI002795F450|nr:hypothetical protein [Massilia sp. REN29]
MPRNYSPLRGLAAAGATVHLKSTTVVELLDELDHLRAGCAKPAKVKRNDYPADFEAVWEVYPQRPGDSKKAAHKAWAARLAAGALVSELLAGAQAYAAFVKAMKTEPMYILHCATFFGPNERYADDWTPPEAQKKPTGGNWWATDASILAKGAELGLAPRSGEYMGQFKARIELAMDPGLAPPAATSPIRPAAVPPAQAQPEQRTRKPEGIGALKDLVRRDPPPARAA